MQAELTSITNMPRSEITDSMIKQAAFNQLEPELWDVITDDDNIDGFYAATKTLRSSLQRQLSTTRLISSMAGQKMWAGMGALPRFMEQLMDRRGRSARRLSIESVVTTTGSAESVTSFCVEPSSLTRRRPLPTENQPSRTDGSGRL
jgi:hypothetical protein